MASEVENKSEGADVSEEEKVKKKKFLARLRDRMLIENIFNGGIEKLQERLNIGELQKKHNAYKKRILFIHIEDVNKSIILQIDEGKINRRFSKTDEVIEADAKIYFRTLLSFLNILKGNTTINDIFCWEGIITDNDGKPVKEILWEGDWLSDSMLLTDIMDEYLNDVREVLFTEMKITGFAIEKYAQFKGHFAKKWNIYDDDEDQESP